MMIGAIDELLERQARSWPRHATHRASDREHARYRRELAWVLRRLQRPGMWRLGSRSHAFSSRFAEALSYRKRRRESQWHDRAELFEECVRVPGPESVCLDGSHGSHY